MYLCWNNDTVLDRLSVTVSITFLILQNGILFPASESKIPMEGNGLLLGSEEATVSISKKVLEPENQMPPQ